MRGGYTVEACEQRGRNKNADAFTFQKPLKSLALCALCACVVVVFPCFLHAKSMKEGFAHLTVHVLCAVCCAALCASLDRGVIACAAHVPGLCSRGTVAYRRAPQ
jgi:hypothetical protein